MTRRRITVCGQVQGVGFRPFIYRLATGLGLCGWVRNGAAGVEIEVQGPAVRVTQFVTRLDSEAPPGAVIQSLQQSIPSGHGKATSFHIVESVGDDIQLALSPDTGVCSACLTEMCDPGDRRHGYPFISCVHCGPRFTIACAMPFDRHTTTLAEFTPCPACRGEYENPESRRFHAQTIACAACGPQLQLLDRQGRDVAGVDVIATVVAALYAGQIVALKGLGGFHLLCDARNAGAVARLRVRKGREAKPLAVMAANPASLSALVYWEEGQRRLLESPSRPIVLLDKGGECDAVLPGVAPAVAQLGVMLPYTPLHYLLFHHAAGKPAGSMWLQQTQSLLLVCTSANRSGEPLITDNHDALACLQGIADCFVVHDRHIAQRCDDSVLQVKSGTPLFVRRARGYVPQAVRLPHPGPAVLALGGDLKNTFCLTQGDAAHVSQHNGDLDHAAACRALEDTLERWLRMVNFSPACIAHDGHPDFFSTRVAQRLAAAHGVPCLAVQHHHAHVAAVMAEQGLDEPVLGVALDGFGLGDDGGLWGGELLRVSGAESRRLGHLHELALPGGDRAAREPWRLAASALHALGRGDEITRRFSYSAAKTVAEMLAKSVNVPLTSSMGRWFDAAAGLLGIASHASYEGQAAMQLEALAQQYGRVEPAGEGYRIDAAGNLNLLPLLESLVDERDVAYGAALFHATLTAALSEWIRTAARQQSLQQVVLNGGCFMNGILREHLRSALGNAGLQVSVPRQLPPNDGGLSLGQAWVAHCRLGGEQT